jgi:tRNA(Ile)-lysidine synthase
MSDLPARFAAHLGQARVFPRPGVAVVAVSGGPDSVALLDLLCGAASATGLELVVAHADHGIRPDSGNVATAVRALAARHGLPFELGELRLGAAATETAARRARYAWLAAVRERHAARYLVTAHHRDDQIETVLLRVLRGSGPAGLAAMPVRSRGGVVRPLLPFTKAELAAHVAALGLPWYEDPANRDVRHLRSWVRAELLPALARRLGPGVGADLARVARAAAAERVAWDRVLELVPELELQTSSRGFAVARVALGRYDDALALALVQAAARRAGLVLGTERGRRLLRLAAGSSGRWMSLGGGWRAEAAFDRLRVTRGQAASVPAGVVAKTTQGRAHFGAYAVTWRLESAPARIARAAWTTWLAGAGWELRPFATGDAVRPLGGVGHRPVRRLLMEARVPRSARVEYPVVARGETILWVPGVCRSADELPAPGTAAVRIDVTGAAGT